MNISKGLYIHIPFCLQKCKYCDFVSFCGQEEQYDLYIDKLLTEASEYKGENVDTVFIGGGTPTILSVSQLSKLFSGIYKTFHVCNGYEFSIESNPKTLDNDKLSILKEYGINRISVGVQSFNNNELKAIGRIHDAESAYNTINMIKKHGFDNINIDIMLSLPGQTEDSLYNTINTAVQLNPTHISCYSLILEEGTKLYDEYASGIYTAIDEDYDRRLYHTAADLLKNSGYERYEISNFSKSGFLCRHNLKYWNCDEYIGLGVAAHSYINSRRFYNTSDISQYLKGNFHSDDICLLNQTEKIKEYIMMRLRLCDGINDNEFFDRFGTYFSQKYFPAINKLISGGFMNKSNNSYFLTDSGFDVSNSIICEFL